MARVRLTLLGGFEARRIAGGTLALPSKKGQALLAYLASPTGQPHRRSKLATLLWGDTADAQARNSLRQTLVTLRRALPVHRPPVLLMAAETIAVNPEAVETDVADFERRLAEGTPTALADAAVLYRGDLLEGLDVDEAPFEAWLLAERERVRELALDGLAKLLGQQEQAGAGDTAIRTATRLLALDPLQEATHRALMRLHARVGRRASALRQYQVCMGVLQRELGVEPEPETQQLYQQILQQKGPRTPSAAPPALGAAATGGPPAAEPPLVGRDSELLRLGEALDAAWRGRGQVVCVLGEGGIGKTRLVDAVAVEATRRRGRVLLARAHETERLLPFRPWVDALRGGRAPGEMDPPPGLPAVWRRELARLFPEFGESIAELSARPEDYVRLFEAVVALLRQLAEKEPLVLVIEDLHWADEMSLRLFAFVSRRITALPLLLVGSVREEEVAEVRVLEQLLQDLAREQLAVLLTLPSLSPAQTLALVRSLARAGIDETSVARIGRDVWAVSAGNPFIVCETMRALQQGTPAEGAEGLSLPQRVREVIAARLERLGPLSQSLLGAAAVVGRDFTFTLLHHVAGLTEAEAAAGVEELVRRRVFHAVGERFDFTHDRIREVAYDGLSGRRRRTLHAAVAEALETLYPNRADEFAERLAHHYARAEHPSKAVTYLHLVSEKAAQRYALEEATRALQDARAFADRLPGSERPRRLVDILVGLARCLYFLGRFRQILELLLDPRNGLEGLDDPSLTGPLNFWIGYAHGLLGDQERARHGLQRALEAAARCGDPVALGRAHCGIAREAFWTGELRDGIEHGRQAVSLLEGTTDRWWLGHAYWVLGINYVYTGALPAALRTQGQAQAVGVAIGDSRLQSFAHWSSAWILTLMGEYPAAIEACQRSLEGSPDPINTALALAHLGYAYVEAGDAAMAIPRVEQALRQLAELRMWKSLGRITIWLAEAYLLRDDLEKAYETAARGFELTETGSHRYGSGEALRTLGRIAEARGRFSEAESRLGDALKNFTSIGARFEAGRTHLALARLARRRGFRPAAAAHLDEARRLFVELAVSRYVERVEAEMRALAGRTSNAGQARGRRVVRAAAARARQRRRRRGPRGKPPRPRG